MMKRHKRIFFHPERCLGCLSCQLACHLQALGLSCFEAVPVGKKPSERMTLTFQVGTPWLEACRHCSSAPCVEACISGSLRQEAGRVIHAPEKCVGCGSCVLACPFGAIRPLEDQDRMIKCNLCEDEVNPPCVASCLTGALVAAEPTAFAQIKRKAFALESTHSTPRSKARGMPLDKLKAPSIAEGLRVDTERRFLPRFKKRGLPSTRAQAEGAPSNVSRRHLGVKAKQS
jgi:carbon-monoxide dehydrogenase iron sulfur subunit